MNMSFENLIRDVYSALGDGGDIQTFIEMHYSIIKGVIGRGRYHKIFSLMQVENSNFLQSNPDLLALPNNIFFLCVFINSEYISCKKLTKINMVDWKVSDLVQVTNGYKCFLEPEDKEGIRVLKGI